MRCSRYSQSNAATHLFDHKRIFQPSDFADKSIGIIFTDRGPDESPNNDVNCFYYGRLWDYYNFDTLIVITRAKGDSCYN